MLLAEPWREGNAEGKARTRQVRTVLKGLWTTTATEKPPQQPSVGMTGSECSRQWSWHRNPASNTQAPSAARSAQRKPGKSPQQDGWTTKQSLISSFASCPQAQQPQCWLLALCQTHSCSCPRTGCEASTGASYPPSWGIPTPLLTSVSPLSMGLFTGRAMTGKKKRELGSLLCSQGEPSSSWLGSSGVCSPLCTLSKLPPARRQG